MGINILNSFSPNHPCRQSAFRGSDIWMAESGTSLEQMDKATGFVTDRPTGIGCNLAIAYDAINDIFWTNASGIANTKVVRMDPLGVVLSAPTVGTHPYSMLIANGSFWCGNQGSITLTKLDAASGAFVATVAVPHNPDNLTYDGTNIWCTSSPHFLMQVDEASGAVVNTFTPAAVGRFSGLIYVAGFLYATDLFNNQLHKLDLAGNVLASYNLLGSGSPGPLSFDGTYFWIGNFAGEVQVVDSTGVALDLIVVSGAMQWVLSGATTWVTTSGPPNHAYELSYTPPVPPIVVPVKGIIDPDGLPYFRLPFCLDFKCDLVFGFSTRK